VSPLASQPPKAHSTDLPAVSETVPTVVVNPLTENSTISAIVLTNNTETNPTPTIENKEKETLLDNTIQSAYPSLIDATMSENEGTICGSELQSRRTSTIKSSSPPIDEELNNIEPLSHNIIPFNPLHVILKKDANKYYTTEFI